MLTWRRALVCLGLGGLTTLAVAWVLALRVVVNVPGGPWVAAEGLWQDVPDKARTWWCQVLKRPGLTVVVWEPGGVESRFTMGRARRSGLLDGDVVIVPYFVGDGKKLAGMRRASAVDKRRIPRWGRPDGPLPDDDNANLVARSARGWPLRAVFYEVHLGTGPMTRDNRGGIEVPASWDWLGPGPVLPGRVLPLGFLADSIFYGALWLGLLVVPAALRRRSRERAGWCVGCAYDLRGSTNERCPECGTPVRGMMDRLGGQA